MLQASHCYLSDTYNLSACVWFMYDYAIYICITFMCHLCVFLFCVDVCFLSLCLWKLGL